MVDDRRDDWRSDVDQKLMSLTTAQRVTDDQIDELELKYEALDKILRGDPENEKDGLAARYHAQENAVLELTAEIRDLRMDLHGGRVGEKSIIDRMITLEGGETTKGFKWQFASAVTAALITVIVAIISLLGLLITHWDKVMAIFPSNKELSIPAGKRRGRVHELPVPEETGQRWR